MRRTLAITLAAAVLLTGGCARQRPAADQPAPATPAAASVKSAAKTPAKAKADPAASADVDGLLDEVDKQLADDSQPSVDQD
jgi:hypothetical protein